ncbi:MAG: hypothetical protein M5U14_21000 [Acidimicrobiia bacterium]|nr:hypothetical protein [Acidimicrobiia bacterium]
MPDASPGSSVAADARKHAKRGRRGTSRRWVAGTACLLLVLAACGDDDESASGDENTAAACDAFVAIDEATFVEDFEGIIAAIEDFVATAPDDVAAAVEPLLPLLRSDPDAVDESEELAAAEGASDEWAWDNCADPQIEVEALNFAFSGMPSEIDAGRVGFRLVNATQTDEFHEALVLRKGDDVAGSPSAALISALGDEVSVDNTFGAFAEFTLVGGGLVDPEGDDIFVVDLEPGEYVLACLLPVGSAELLEAYFSGEHVEGEYHIHQGMFAEFTVS